MRKFMEARREIEKKNDLWTCCLTCFQHNCLIGFLWKNYLNNYLNYGKFVQNFNRIIVEVE